MMDGTAVNAIADLAKGEATPKVVDVQPGSFVDRPLYLPPSESTPIPINVSTLSSVVDYLEGDPDELKSDTGKLEAFVVVDGPTRVSVVGALTGRPLIRPCYIVAEHATPEGPLSAPGQWMSIEQLLIALQSQFDEGGDRDALLKILGNVQDELVQTSEDDGVTQRVQVRAGIQRRAEVEVPRLVRLQTRFATFPELGPIARQFVFRMKSGAKDGVQPTATLIDADPTWKWTVAALIQKHLEAKVKNLVVR